MDREAPTLRADKPHTVRELTGRLLELVRLGYEDAGFPVLTKEAAVDREGRTYPVLRVVGFLGINELEHALSALADEPDAVVNLTPDEMMRSSRLSIFSFSESVDGRHNPYDLSQYIDRVSVNAEMGSRSRYGCHGFAVASPKMKRGCKLTKHRLRSLFRCTRR